eukprot:467875-Prymnesium_polylepis.2
MFAWERPDVGSTQTPCGLRGREGGAQSYLRPRAKGASTNSSVRQLLDGRARRHQHAAPEQRGTQAPCWPPAALPSFSSGNYVSLSSVTVRGSATRLRSPT